MVDQLGAYAYLPPTTNRRQAKVEIRLFSSLWPTMTGIEPTSRTVRGKHAPAIKLYQSQASLAEWVSGLLLYTRDSDKTAVAS